MHPIRGRIALDVAAKTKGKKEKRASWGGRREGAGRKRLDGVGTQVVAVRLTPAHIERAERWQESHELENFSAAVRSMIDVASATER
jgi:hypothetical protein